MPDRVRPIASPGLGRLVWGAAAVVASPTTLFCGGEGGDCPGLIVGERKEWRDDVMDLR